MEVDTVDGSNETLGGQSTVGSCSPQSNRAGLSSQRETLGCVRRKHSSTRPGGGEKSTRKVDSSNTLNGNSSICDSVPESEFIAKDDRNSVAEVVCDRVYGEVSSPSCNGGGYGGDHILGRLPSKAPDCAGVVEYKFDEDAPCSPTSVETEKESLTLEGDKDGSGSDHEKSPRIGSYGEHVETMSTSDFQPRYCYQRDSYRETDDLYTQHPSLSTDLWSHHSLSSSYLEDGHRGVPCSQRRGWSSGESAEEDRGLPLAKILSHEGESRGNLDGEVLSTSLSLAADDAEPTGMGAGLLNLGNTCFMNAILQCFTHTVALVDALRSCTHATPCNAEGFCVLCALREHINLCLASSGKIVSPTKLFDNLHYISSSFCKYQQEDAHEFLQSLLDRVEICCLGSNSGDGSSSWQDKNIVKHVFGGRLVSKLRCCNCGHCSQRFEPLIDLSLEIKEAETLQHALESFTKVEKMEDTKFTCENCKVEVTMEKQLMLDQVPSVVALQLKRFKTDGAFIEKIGKHVEFPLHLDFKPYTNCIDETNVDLNYRLYAIVVHNGFLPTSGHYYCYIQSSPGTWHRLDDSKVRQIEEQWVLTQSAYILFYAKEGTPWFSTFFESEKHPADSSVSSTSPKSVLDNVDGDCLSNPGVFKSVSDDTDDGFTSNPNEAGNSSCEVSVGGGVKVGDSSQLPFGEMVEEVHSKNCLKETMETQAAIPTDILMVDAFVPPGAEDRNSRDENLGTSPFLEESNCYQIPDSTGGSNALHPSTPPSSFHETNPVELPEERFGHRRDRVKEEDSRVNGKRSSSKREAKDSHRKEAMRYVNKRMSGSRAIGFSKALKLSPCKRVSPRSRRKTPVRAAVGVTR